MIKYLCFIICQAIYMNGCIIKKKINIDILTIKEKNITFRIDTNINLSNLKSIEINYGDNNKTVNNYFVQFFSYTYSTKGLYNLTVKIINKDGEEFTKSISIEIS